MNGKTMRLINKVAKEMRGTEKQDVWLNGGRSGKDQVKITRDVSRRGFKRRILKEWRALGDQQKEVQRKEWLELLKPNTEE